MPDHRVADRSTDCKTRACPRGSVGSCAAIEGDHHGAPRRAPAAPNGRGEIPAAPEPSSRGQHNSSRLSRESLAALKPPRSHNRAPGPGTHAQPEAMRARAPAVVRLKGALAHGCSLRRLCRAVAWDGHINQGHRPVHSTVGARQGQTGCIRHADEAQNSPRRLWTTACPGVRDAVSVHLSRRSFPSRLAGGIDATWRRPQVLIWREVRPSPHRAYTGCG